jgi:hypothetical protein
MIEPANDLLGLIRRLCGMGITLPVYPPDDWDKLGKQKRADLTSAMLHVLQYDPDVKKLLEPKLGEIQVLLKTKTAEVYKALAGAHRK